MSVLVFLHKSKCVEWHNVVMRSRNGELIKKSQGACGQMKAATTMKLGDKSTIHSL